MQAERYPFIVFLLLVEAGLQRGHSVRNLEPEGRRSNFEGVE